MTLVLAFALEVSYRSQGAARRMLRGQAPYVGPGANELHPYADSSWWPEFVAERDAIRGRWEPYTYSRMEPLQGRYITIDGDGFRVTPEPPQSPDGSTNPLRVFFFGGSTTFGFADRNENTRPAQVAWGLASAGYAPEVLNFGQLGYVSTQEVLTLIGELRMGNIPDVVVFWDGLNDMNSMRDHGVPGRTFRERQRAQGFELISAMETRGGAVDAPLAIRSLLHHSQLYERILLFVRDAPILPPLAPPDRFCEDVVGYWMQLVRVVDRLAVAYGFEALMVWQPTWQSSDRPKTAYERAVAVTSLLPAHRGMEAHVTRCGELVDSLERTAASPSLRNWAWLHRNDSSTVFLDGYGHTTERATAIEAERLTAEIIQLVEAGEGHDPSR